MSFVSSVCRSNGDTCQFDACENSTLCEDKITHRVLLDNWDGKTAVMGGRAIRCHPIFFKGDIPPCNPISHFHFGLREAIRRLAHESPVRAVLSAFQPGNQISEF